MNIEEAVSLLEIDNEVTSEGIDSAYKKLASKYHPDKGGDTDEMARINKARDLLQDNISVNNLPAVIKQFELTVKEMNVVAREQRALEKRVEKSEKEILTSATTRFKSYKNIAIVFTALSAAAFFLGKEIPKEITSSFIPEVGASPKSVPAPVINELVMAAQLKVDTSKGNVELTEQEAEVLKEYKSDINKYNKDQYLIASYQKRKAEAKLFSLMWYAMTFGVGICAGLGAWLCNQRIIHIEEELKELLEDLSFKSQYVSVLQDLFEDKLKSSWTFNDLLETVSSNRHNNYRLISLVREVGSRKIAQLIINKGLESSAITVSHGGLENRYEETYSIS